MLMKTGEPWGPASGEETSGSPPASGLPPYDPAVVGEIVSTLNRRTTYREVALALRSGIRDISAEFSFLRIRGLQNLLKSLRSIANDDSAVAFFCHSQSSPELQVVPVLFQNTLRQPKDDPILNLDHIFGTEPLRVHSPATESEVALALRAVEGCCLLHKKSRILSQQCNAVKVLVQILSSGGVAEQGACLDALMSLMLDCPANQMEFEAFHGVEKIAEIIKDVHGDETLRLKSGEFLLLLVGHVNGRERPPLLTINDCIRQLLGEKCASLIWAASQFGSTLDPEQRQTALHIQARRVLESVDLY